ncbi:hypothetical protein HHI36_024111 [Cryptolaemus montrouzieri]|uniref:Uncharacterized protein n=1 Tax=Cryptolaemus montrouzieri TaxID=559131 RepID=A0ABD2MMY3_9CUCU
MRTEHRDQASICPFALREVSVLAELALGHLRYSLTDVPPQSNSPPDSVLGSDHAGAFIGARNNATRPRPCCSRKRTTTERGRHEVRDAALRAWLENTVTAAAS